MRATSELDCESSLGRSWDRVIQPQIVLHLCRRLTKALVKRILVDILPAMQSYLLVSLSLSLSLSRLALALL
jgi:hypothetical protein